MSGAMEKCSTTFWVFFVVTCASVPPLISATARQGAREFADGTTEVVTTTAGSRAGRREIVAHGFWMFFLEACGNAPLNLGRWHFGITGRQGTCDSSLTERLRRCVMTTLPTSHVTTNALLQMV